MTLILKDWMIEWSKASLTEFNRNYIIYNIIRDLL